MRVLLTGANGYIGRRLLPQLREAGHEVVCLVRDARRFREASPELGERGEEGPPLAVVEGDLLRPESLPELEGRFDAAYYLVHSMGSGRKRFDDLERRAATHFVEWIDRSDVGQVIYLGGIANAEALSRHLASRQETEVLLSRGAAPLTVLRAAIIIGSGSASFEIIRDLVEKLPVMVAPRWLETRCQPIAIRDVLFYLTGVLGKREAYGEAFDIGGPDILDYREMLLGYAKVRGLRRWIFTVPVLTPRLSSYWLYFVTSTSYPLARSLVDSMRNEVVCADDRITRLLPRERSGYHRAVELAFTKIEQGDIISSWHDALASGRMDSRLMDHLETPQHGVLSDERVVEFSTDPDAVKQSLWRIGGHNGWYAMDWAWQLRGWLDRLVGGTGLRRGRRHPTQLRPGDALDFWRVLVADQERGRLLLYAEMRLPGEAWLEWRVEPLEESAGKAELPSQSEAAQPDYWLRQVATFRPSGLLGRLYWYAVLPIHGFVFRGMANAIVARARPDSLVAGEGAAIGDN